MKKRYWVLITMIFISVLAFTLESEKPVVKREDELSKKRSEELVKVVKRRLKKIKVPRMSFDKKNAFFVALNAVSDRKDSEVIVELKQLKESYNGKRLLRCFFDSKKEEGLEKIKEDYGISFLDDVEKFAHLDNGILLEGDFKTEHFDDIRNHPAIREEKYGEHDYFFSGFRRSNFESMAIHDERILYIGKSPTGRKLLETYEGKRVADDSFNHDVSGEVYGVLPTERFLNFLNHKNMINRIIRKEIIAVADKVGFSLDFSDGVALNANFKGENRDEMSYLAEKIETAFSVFRASIMDIAEDHELKEFFEQSNIELSENDAGYNLNIALSQEFFDKFIDECLEKQENLERDGGA